MIKRIWIFILATAVVSCATPLTQDGSKVRVGGSPEFVKGCEFLGVVNESHYSGWNPEDNRAQALNSARNKVAEMGGNLLYVTSELFRGVQADVYKCDFVKPK